MSRSKESGLEHLADLSFDQGASEQGLIVRLKGVPFDVKIFKIVAPNGDIEWVVTNGLDQSVNLEVAKEKSDTRWQVEDFHRGFKQLTGSEKCQCRKARSQRNHLACCYLAWATLKVKAKEMGNTIYQIRKNLFTDFLIEQLQNPTIAAL